MSEGRPGDIAVYDCAPVHVGRTLRFLSEHRLWRDPLSRRVDEDDLVLGEPYSCDELPLAFGDYFCGLAQAAPTLTFRATLRSTPDRNGELIVHSPDLGLFRAETDAGGAVIWGEPEVEAFLAEHRDDDNPVAALWVAFGKPWNDLIWRLDTRELRGRVMRALPGDGVHTYLPPCVLGLETTVPCSDVACDQLPCALPPLVQGPAARS